jgi:hypothetical protein
MLDDADGRRNSVVYHDVVVDVMDIPHSIQMWDDVVANAADGADVVDMMGMMMAMWMLMCHVTRFFETMCTKMMRMRMMRVWM